jgi:hypothetical protein
MLFSDTVPTERGSHDLSKARPGSDQLQMVAAGLKGGHILYLRIYTFMHASFTVTVADNTAFTLER